MAMTHVGYVNISGVQTNAGDIPGSEGGGSGGLNSYTPSQFVYANSATTNASTPYLTLNGPTVIASGSISANNFIYGQPSTVSSVTTINMTSSSSQTQIITGTHTQTIVLPNAETIQLSQFYKFINNSTGVLSIQTFGGSGLTTLSGSSDLEVALITNSTTAGTWSFGGEITGLTTNQVVYANSPNSVASTGALTLTGSAVSCNGTLIVKPTVDASDVFDVVTANGLQKVVEVDTNTNGYVALNAAQVVIAAAGSDSTTFFEILNEASSTAILTVDTATPVVAGAAFRASNLTASSVVVSDPSKNIISASGYANNDFMVATGAGSIGSTSALALSSGNLVSTGSIKGTNLIDTSLAGTTFLLTADSNGQLVASSVPVTFLGTVSSGDIIKGTGTNVIGNSSTISESG